MFGRLLDSVPAEPPAKCESDTQKFELSEVHVLATSCDKVTNRNLKRAPAGVAYLISQVDHQK